MKLLNWIISLMDNIVSLERCLQCKTAGPRICKQCLKQIPHPEHDLPDHIFALYEYRNKYVKQILTDAKYRKKFSGLKIFDHVMHDAVMDIVSEYDELTNHDKILLIPVPISNKRLKQRGYNQAEIIAKSITSLNPKFKTNTNIIKKIKDRTPQASIHNRKDRLNSPIGTFTITDKEIVQNSFCIIIDDITTTGGTINEMRRLLVEAGALTVIGLTIAH